MPNKNRRLNCGRVNPFRSFFKTLLFSFILISITALAYGQEDHVVTVNGVGDIVAGSEGRARDTAIDDALRKAVEQAIGIFIQSETVVQDLSLVSDEILARSAGYVKKYDVVNESKDKTIYKVTVRATISSEKLRDDLMAIGLLMARKHKPRVMIVITEQNFGKRVLNPIGETWIIKKFLEKGFKLVDQSQVSKIRYNDKIKAAIDGNAGLAGEIGRQHGAEVIIIGAAFSEPLENNLAGLISSRARIDARVIKTDTAEIMVADGKQATGIDITEAIAGKIAIQKAAEELSDNIIEQILAKWSDEISNNVSVEIVIDGASRSQLIELKSLLSSSFRGVKGVHERSFADGRAILEIDMKGDSQAFADELTGKVYSGFSIEITDFSAGRIEAKIVKKTRQ